MKKTIMILLAGCLATVAKAQLPKTNFSFDGSTLNSSNSANTYSFGLKTGTAKYSTAVRSGNGTHALSLNGLDRMGIDNFVLDTGAKAVTVALWVKKGDPINTDGTLCGQIRIDKPATNVSFYISTFNLQIQQNRFYAEWYRDNAYSNSVTSTDTLNNEWNHLTMVWKSIGGYYKIYLYNNGNLTDSGTAPAKVNKEGAYGPLTIGAIEKKTFSGPPTSVNVAAFKGLIDEVKIYERALSKAEIQQLAGSALAVKTKEVTSLRLFPNPTNQYFTISSDGSYTLSLFDGTGKEVMKGKTNEQLSIADLASGIYAVRVSINNQINTLKLVKQ